MTTIQNLDSAKLGDTIQVDPGTYSLTVTKSFTLTVSQVSTPPIVPNNDSQAKINELLKVGNVKLPAGVFFVSDSILYQSGRTIEGTPDDKGNLLTTIKLAKGLALWGSPGSVANEKAMIMANNCSNITLKNIIVDGSQEDFYPTIARGAYHYTMSNFVGCSGLTITNCIFKNGVNDGILLVNSSHIDIDKVTVNKPGHDCIYCYKILDVSVTNCTFVNRDNSSCRFDTVSGGKFLHNVCSSSGGGYAALELENAVTDIECAFNKVAKNVPGGIVARVHTTETRVNIHDNTLF